MRTLLFFLAVATPAAAQVPAGSQDSLRARAVATGALAVGAHPLSDTTWLRPDLREASVAVTEELRRIGDEPSEFYVTFSRRDSGTVVVFHLWHRSAFYPENAHVDGNPGGKCLDVWYDLQKEAITGRFVWQ